MHKVLKFQSPFERLKDYTDCSMQKLYKAIITQAIIDATNISDDKTPKYVELKAKEWIFGNSDDFKNTAYFANLEPGFVQKIAREAIQLQQEKTNITSKKFSDHKQEKKKLHQIFKQKKFNSI